MNLQDFKGILKILKAFSRILRNSKELPVPAGPESFESSSF